MILPWRGSTAMVPLIPVLVAVMVLSSILMAVVTTVPTAWRCRRMERYCWPVSDLTLILNLRLQRYTSDGDLDTSFGFVNTLDGSSGYTLGESPVILDADVQVYDAELSAADNYSGASLTLVRNGGANVNDLFSATGNLAALTESGNLVLSGVTVGTVTTNSAGTLTLIFNANATQARINETLQSIAYANSGNTPAYVQIDWTFDDGNSGAQGTGGALQVAGSTTVAVTRQLGSQARFNTFDLRRCD